VPSQDWPYATYVLQHESGICPWKWEGQIGYCPTRYEPRRPEDSPKIGYGLCQSTPATDLERLRSV
jgi:hypothetical protein